MKKIVYMLLLPAVALGQGVTKKDTAQTFTSTAPSDTPGFRCAVDGCRVDLGNGSLDYFKSDGEAIVAPGQVWVLGTMHIGASAQTSGTAAPTTGTYARGSIVWNSAPSAAGPPGWMCVTAGTPGTWKAMANLAP